MSKLQLGEYLVRAGLITESELRVAESEKARHKGDLSRALLEMDFADEKELMPLLGNFFNVPYVNLSDQAIDEEAVKLLDEHFCRHNECIAFEIDEQRFLHVAMARPNDLELFDQIRVATQRNIRQFIAGPADIQTTLTRVLRGAREMSPEMQFSLMNETLLELEEEAPQDQEDEFGAVEAPRDLEDEITLPPADPGPSGEAPTMQLEVGEVGGLRQELRDFMTRTDQFLYALAWHLTTRGHLPPGLVSGQVVPYPGGGPEGMKEAAATVPPSVVAPEKPAAPTPAAPPARARATPPQASPQARPTVPAPPTHQMQPRPKRQTGEGPLAAAPITPEPSLGPAGNRGGDSSGVGAHVRAMRARPTPPPPRPAQTRRRSPTGSPPPVDDVITDEPPRDEPSVVDRPVRGERIEPVEAPRSRSKVVTSDGAGRAAASGEIGSTPSADPSATSVVLMELPEAVDEPIVALDFGTTRSSVAMLVENKLEVMKLPRVAVLKLPGGEWDMPSAVAFRKDGTVMLGQSARKLAATDPASSVMSPKRLIGRQFDDPQVQPMLANMAASTVAGPNGEVMVKVRGREISITEVCAHILNLLRLVAQRNLKREVKDVVLSAPVSWKEPQYLALQQAASMAGLNVVGFVDEPVAAALSNRYDASFQGLVAVYDFGGGTFDFTVVETQRTGLKVVAKGGDAWLGGDDIDLALANAAANAFWRETGIELRNQAAQWQQLLMASEYAKCELSLRNKSAIHVKRVALTAKGAYDIHFPLSRQLFASLIREIVERTLDTCQETLTRSSVRIDDLNAVFVSGGSSYIPAVQNALADFFGKVPRSSVPPERAVLVGAAIQRAFIDRRQG
jgi:actin-like ATPase involved in cell morphogenesis